MDTGPGWGWSRLLCPDGANSDYKRQLRPADRTHPTTPAVSASIPEFFVTDRASEVWTAGSRECCRQADSAVICDVAASNYVAGVGTEEPGSDGNGLFFRKTAHSPGRDT